MTKSPDSFDHEPMVVPAALAGERIDRSIALLTGWSRTEVQALVRAGDVLVAGQTVSNSRRLETGEVIEILAAPIEAPAPGPEPIALDVRFVDDDVIVLAKPAGLVVHPGPGHDHGTIVHGLLHRFPEVADVGEPSRPGIVHRLDRDTSGLMMAARSARAYDALVEAFATHAVDRRYLALVSGTPGARRGVVDAPIGRSTRRRTRMAVRETGRSARTSYSVRRSWSDPDVALLECALETGRTHQVRVHLSAIGHPIVGDRTYGGRLFPAAPPRPFLHAFALAFDHPVSGDRISLEDPLVTELVAVLDSLGPPSWEQDQDRDSDGDSDRHPDPGT